MLSVLCIFLSLFVLFALYVQTKRRLEMWAREDHISDRRMERLNQHFNKVMDSLRKPYE